MIQTLSTSGTVSTQYFGEKYNGTKLEKDIAFGIRFYPPDDVQMNDNVTIYFEVEKNLIHGLDNFIEKGNEDIRKTSYRTQFTPAGVSQYYGLTRTISLDDSYDLKMMSMPGFRIKWYFSEEINPYNILNSSKIFRRYDLIH